MSERVNHPEHGPGEIVTLRRGGRVAIVDFESRPMPTHVPLRECEDVDGESPGRDVAERPSTTDLLSSGPEFEGTRDETGARLTLEAMRLGVVPSSDLDVYTVGRDVELGLIESDFARFSKEEGATRQSEMTETGAGAPKTGAVRAILGDYGTGKTHLLELIRQRALERGFLVGRVVLDPRETKPNLPKRIYREAIRSLSYPDRPSDAEPGLEPLFRKAIDEPEVMETFDVGGSGERDDRLDDGMHLYVTPALAYFRRLWSDESVERLGDVLPERLSDRDDFEFDGVEAFVEQARASVLDWIEGRPTMSTTELNRQLAPLQGMPHLYSLMDYRPWARIYGYLLSGLSAVARMVGYSGIVMLVDEAERYSLLSKENRRYAQYVLKALSIAAVGDRRVPFERRELEEIGGWGIQQELPPRYPEASALYSVFAMTPNEQGVETLESALPPEKISELERFDDHDYRRLASKVCDFYASAHPEWRLSERLVNRVTKLMEEARRSGQIGNPRQAMKFIVEFLDLARHRPTSLDRVTDQIERDAVF